MKKLVLIAILLSVIIKTYAQKENFSILTGKYLGQKEPGTVPELFAPTFLQADETWFWHGYPSISPDLKEMFFVKYLKSQAITELHYMKMEDNVWKSPGKVSFAISEYGDNNPFFMGIDTILFYSRRFGGSVFRVVMHKNGWSNPEKMLMSLPAGKFLGGQFSVTKDKKIFAELDDGDIYCWKPENGKYSVFEKLSNDVNTDEYEFMPFIEPNEKFLLFCRQAKDGFGKTDIYVSFRNTNGTWTKALNIGSKINTPQEEAFPSVSPDGKFFIFCREGKFGFNPYWVSVKIIEELKPKDLK